MFANSPTRVLNLLAILGVTLAFCRLCHPLGTLPPQPISNNSYVSHSLRTSSVAKGRVTSRFSPHFCSQSVCWVCGNGQEKGTTPWPQAREKGARVRVGGLQTTKIQKKLIVDLDLRQTTIRCVESFARAEVAKVQRRAKAGAKRKSKWRKHYGIKTDA